MELTRISTKSLWGILKVEGRGEVYKMFRHIDAPSFLFMPIAAYRCLTLGRGGGFCLNIKYYFVCFLLKLDFELFSIFNVSMKMNYFHTMTTSLVVKKLFLIE